MRRSRFIIFATLVALAVAAFGEFGGGADAEISREAREMFARLDADRSGSLTMAEAKPDQRKMVEQIFAMAGKPPNGSVSPEEFGVVFEQHRAGRPGGPPPAPPTDLVPLPELGRGEYHGIRGGLYPDGANERPKAHEAVGLERAGRVQPLDGNGRPSDTGTIVLLSLGMSNTSQLSEGFAAALRQRRDLNPRMQFVNGAQGGMTASVIQHENDGRGADFWRIVDKRLRALGLSRGQVQAVWMKQADAAPQEDFPDYARRLEREQLRILEIVHERFPNCGLAYLSSRTYGGYATTSLNPEPYAYESAFAVKRLVERQIAGDPALNYDPAKGAVRVPWISWGPYLWANGAKARGDGFFSVRDDFREDDGTHHSPQGATKVGKFVFDFFTTDTTTRSWFLAP